MEITRNYDAFGISVRVFGFDFADVCEQWFYETAFVGRAVFLVIYTYAKKNFGQQIEKNISPQRQLLNAVAISFVVGLYDGFIGPGTGSFLVVAFIAIMGFDFLHASANAKMVNLATNFGSICLFMLKGKIIWAIAIPMAASNALGGWLGAKLAINKGNGFIRIFFLVVVIGTLVRFAYDVFYK